MSNIDIIWPFYKDYKYLDRSIVNINSQSLLPKNLIFIDDGNFDKKLKKYLRGKIKKKIKLKYIKNNKNIGPEKCLTNSFKYIKSKYFYIKSSDDEIKRNFLKENISILEKSASSPFVFSNIKINNTLNKTKYELNFPFIKLGYNTPEDVKKILKKNQFKIYHNTVVFNSSLFLKKNLFSYFYGFRCDMLNLQFLSFRYGFSYLDKYLSEFTIRKNQWGSVQSDSYLINELKKLKVNQKKFYYLYINSNLHYDLSIFSIPFLIKEGFSEVISLTWINRSIKFYIWKKIRFYINPKILKILFRFFN